MNLAALRKAIRQAMSFEPAGAAELDGNAASALETWRTQHQGKDLAACEPASSASTWVAPEVAPAR